MSDVTVRFGSGLSPQQWYLPGTPITLLPHRPAGDPPPAANALSSQTFGPASSQTMLFGDRVLADTTAGDPHLFDVIGRWNSVKNAAASSSAAEDLRFDGFVQVDAHVGSATAEASHLDLIGAKRGNLVTGAGDDAIHIAFATNAASASNAFRVHSGAGNDQVTVASLDLAAKIASGDSTYHSGLHAGGAATRAYVDLGAGNDTVSGGAERDVVHAGAGNDVIDTGTGHDTIRGGDGADVISGSGGNDVLMGGQGNDVLTGGEGKAFSGLLRLVRSASPRLVTTAAWFQSSAAIGSPTLPPVT